MNSYWLEEARVIAAQCWCDNETKDIEIDVRLAEVFARRIAAWMDTASQNQGNADYYRRLLIRCGEIIGDRAYVCEDGSKSDTVLCSKIPEIIAEDYIHGD